MTTELKTELGPCLNKTIHHELHKVRIYGRADIRKLLASKANMQRCISGGTSMI